MKNKQIFLITFLISITSNLWANDIWSPIKQISAGDNYTLALKEDGSIWAWGKNNYGQLGDGTTTNQSIPVQISINNVQLIDAGNEHSLALKKDNTVWAWGRNDGGQLGDGTYTAKSTPVQVTGIDNVKLISAGHSHNLALKEDGTVWTWGGGGFLSDQYGNSTVVPVRIKDLDHIKLISAGTSFSLALKEDGTVWSWGDNNHGKLGDGTFSHRKTPVQVKGIDNVKLLSAGGTFSLALKEDATIWSWGDNNLNQIGDETKLDIKTPVQIKGIDNVKFISAANYHSLALKEDGTVWTWGYNNYGQIGDGTTKNRKTPFNTGLDNVRLLSTGYHHNFALKEERCLWGWGLNSNKCICYHNPSTKIKNPIRVSNFPITKSHPCSKLWFISNAIEIEIRFIIPYGFYFHIDDKAGTQISITNSTYESITITTISENIATKQGTHYLHFSIANSDYWPTETHHFQYNHFNQQLSVESSTHPDQNQFYPVHDVSINVTNSKPGINFRYVWDKNPTTIPDASSLTNHTGMFSNTFPYIGIYYLHLRAEDSLGNLASEDLTTHRPINISFPSLPYIVSSTHPNQNEWYTLANVAIEYTNPKGNFNFRYIVDNQPGTIPDESAILKSSNNFVLPGQAPGTYYVHIRAEYSDGTLYPEFLTSHFRYNIIDNGETPPTILPIIDNLTVTPTVTNTEFITIQADVILNH